MFKKILLVISVLALITAVFLFINAAYQKQRVYLPEANNSDSGVKQLPQPAKELPLTKTEKALPPKLDIPLDKIDIQSSNDAYSKASSLATRSPEVEDITKLVPVLLKFSPSELSTLTRLASRTMTKDEIEQAKSILLGRLNQEDISLLLQLGPKYGLDFRAVLGVTDKPKK